MANFNTYCCITWVFHTQSTFDFATDCHYQLLKYGSLDSGLKLWNYDNTYQHL